MSLSARPAAMSNLSQVVSSPDIFMDIMYSFARNHMQMRERDAETAICYILCHYIADLSNAYTK